MPIHTYRLNIAVRTLTNKSKLLYYSSIYMYAEVHKQTHVHMLVSLDSWSICVPWFLLIIIFIPFFGLLWFWNIGLTTIKAERNNNNNYNNNKWRNKREKENRTKKYIRKWKRNQHAFCDMRKLWFYCVNIITIDDIQLKLYIL